jgi:hypothetical protein
MEKILLNWDLNLDPLGNKSEHFGLAIFHLVKESLLCLKV